MKLAHLTKACLKAAGIGTFFRPRDVEPLGVTFAALQRLVHSGMVHKLGPGVYRLAEVKPSELESIAMVAAAIQGGIICLLSALCVHGIRTQAPREVWLAIDRKARKPVRLPTQVRVVRFSGPMLTNGVKTQSILDVPARVTSPARTVVDCFRYRNKLGLGVATAALRDALRLHLVTVGEILRTAEVCRARTVIQPYLEAMAT